MMNEQFYSSFSELNHNHIFSEFKSRTNQKCTINKEEVFSNINVLKIIKKLNKFKSVGTDGISNFVLKECQIAFSAMLSKIFIKSY